MPVYVGVSANLAADEGTHSLRGSYLEAVKRAGGVPIIIPCMGSELVPVYGQKINALVLSGGGDIDPIHWGEAAQRGLGAVTPERDYFELAMARWAVANDIPLLAICRGMQVLNVALGGNLYQDIRGGRQMHYQNAPRDYPIHDIIINEDTMLAGLLGRNVLRVNSFHHQAVKQVGNGLKIGALARDGMVEAIEMENHKFVLGVQWHPESLIGPPGEGLFKALVKACLRKKDK
ncbi:MAG: gamma-glutamyl-gamma-aminobutyrate hydrolase family protein [Methylocystaceae bacterium]